MQTLDADPFGVGRADAGTPRPISVELELDDVRVQAGGRVCGRVVLRAAERCRCAELRLSLRWLVSERRAAEGAGGELAGRLGSVATRAVEAPAEVEPAAIEEELAVEYALEAGRWVRRSGSPSAERGDSELADVIGSTPYRDGLRRAETTTDGALELSREPLVLGFRLRAPLGPLSIRGERLRLQWQLEAMARLEQGPACAARRPLELEPGSAEAYCYGVGEPPSAAPVPFTRRPVRHALGGAAVLLAVAVVLAPWVWGAVPRDLSLVGVLAAALLLGGALRPRWSPAGLGRAHAETAGGARAGSPIEIAVRVPVQLPVQRLDLTLEAVERWTQGIAARELRTAVANVSVPHAGLEPRDADREIVRSSGGGRHAASRSRRGGWLLATQVALPADIAPSFQGRRAALSWEIRVALDYGGPFEPVARAPIVVRPALASAPAATARSEADGDAVAARAEGAPRGAVATTASSPVAALAFLPIHRQAG